MSYYTPKWIVPVTLLIAVAVSGSFPATGFLSAKFQYVLIKSEYDPDWVVERNWTVGIWLVLTAAMAFFMMSERICVGLGGENLSCNVRNDLMRSILYKQISWFDNEKRAPGILTTIFAEDVSVLNGMTTETVILIL